MSAAFPPQPVYPLALDSDTTLFLVHNTVETRLAVNNEAWACDMEIVPVGADEDEIWSENGFGNIEGELFYYDSVEKDVNGKIFKLKRLARNLSGNQTKFNLAGVFVRSYIIAEHHNQLVDVICLIEKYIGICTEAQLEACPDDLPRDTLDCKIRRLIEENACTDDVGCPDVDFGFEIVSEDPCLGTVTNFDIGITGNFTNYRLDFGDGQFTTTEQVGSHTYAPNAIIDPIVNVSNTNCQVVQTPISRTNPNEPEELPPTVPFEVPLPVVPDFPAIVIPDIDIPPTTLEFPQIIFPCLDTSIPDIVVNIDPPELSITPIPIPIEITISAFDINFGPSPLPSVIEFGLNPLPTTIFFGPSPLPLFIGFGPAPTIAVDYGTPPSIDVSFGPAPSFSPIGFGPAPTISVGPAPSSSPIEFGPSPTVSVSWGTPPTCSCTVSVVCPGGSPSPFAAKSMFVDDDFIDGFEYDTPIDLEPMENLGIPSEIKIMAPDLPEIKIVTDIPTKLTVEVPEIPDIKILSPEVPLPTQIEIVNKTDLPKSIAIDASGIPKAINVDMPFKIPEKINVELPDDFPTTIKIDASEIPDRIQVIGIPESIKVEGIPDKIITEFKMPEDAKIPLVYEGGPIPVKFSEASITDDDGEVCFKLVPCNPK